MNVAVLFFLTLSMDFYDCFWYAIGQKPVQSQKNNVDLCANVILLALNWFLFILSIQKNNIRAEVIPPLR